MKLVNNIVLIFSILLVSCAGGEKRIVDKNKLLTCPYTVEQSYEYLKSNFSPDVSNIKSATELASTTSLIFGESGFNDNDLPYLCSLKELTSLDIYNDNKPADKMLTGKNLKYLTFLKKLKRLDLDANQIKGTDIKELIGLDSLEFIKIGMGNPLGAEGLEALGDLQNLKTVYLQAANITSKDLAWLGKLNRVLDFVYLGDNPIDNEAMKYIALAKVRSIYLGRTNINSSKNFDSLLSSQWLEEVSLNSLPVQEEEKVNLYLSKMPRIKSMFVCLPISEDLLENVISSKTISKLSLSLCNESVPLSYETLRSISMMKNLKELSLSKFDPSEKLGTIFKEALSLTDISISLDKPSENIFKEILAMLDELLLVESRKITLSFSMDYYMGGVREAFKTFVKDIKVRYTGRVKCLSPAGIEM